MKAVSDQALRVLRALGDKTATKVISTVGPEQEYFLLDKNFYLQRLDLIATGRTLFGAPPPKGQELEDQYFGAIKDRVSAFMRDLDIELWKMGIPSKTKHNEVAPAQYEMAPVFSTTNIAADHNQLVMETMQKVALRHGMVCLLHEKPYAGVNGSGKHNNWSLATDTGLNLLEPGNTPHENAQFLVFLCALLKAVDTHADILRATCANSGNDHRLGANEAPPAIISVFLGDELTEILERLGKGQKASSQAARTSSTSASTRCRSCRRTTPTATGPRRSPSPATSSSSAWSAPRSRSRARTSRSTRSWPRRSTRSPRASRRRKDRNAEIAAIVKDTCKKHGRVDLQRQQLRRGVGEGGREARPPERAQRGGRARGVRHAEGGRSCSRSTRCCRKEELHSRYDIYLEQYAKHINIEAQTASQMVRRQFIPAAMRF